VHSIGNGVNPALWAAIQTRAGGEVAPAEW
jgi:hypothetical protein